MLKQVKIDENVANFVMLRSCEYDLNITKLDLVELLRITTKFQLFQFEGKLYKQMNDVAVGSPLGPLKSWQTPSCAKSRNSKKDRTSCLSSTNAL